MNAVSRVLEEIHSAFEVSHSLSLTLCNHSRTFDCVCHITFLRKVEFYGVWGIKYFFENYL